VSIAEVAERLLRLAGTEMTLVPDSELMRPVDVPIVRGDPTKLQRATGWQPQYDLDTTLRDVLDQWRERVA
jgi:GDP-4-dehydro-6-deoxy-D-mannose reductase